MLDQQVKRARKGARRTSKVGRLKSERMGSTAKETFGQWFRKIRQGRKLTQEKAAKELSIESPTTLSRWEDGRALPRANQIRKLTLWGRISPKALLELLESSAE